ncbi:hypothetical protein Baya_1406 [Bagarius yarrelli]|uniref:Fibronectin type-III domain-containing protein n=1 Tax=Bagarius yarrelli TaxID=175774 RepID=A0A556TL02_BAGYA|nr:hypothetical protein Baya_1406 [Bagarius yarrelli]
MIDDHHHNIMHFNILGYLIVFTVLELKHAQVPTPSKVTVKCDSYGVVVEWMAAGLSQEAEFELEIKPNFGQIISVRNKYLRYNISELLKDPSYNVYVVKVKVRDGKNESEFLESEAFSYNFLMRANVTCDLEFPPVTLFPRDGNLFVQFVNPLHLYRNTPALRDLTKSDTLQYSLNDDKARNQEHPSTSLFLLYTLEFCCSLHFGSFTALPVTTYLIPLLLASGLFVTLALASVFLVKKVKKIIQKKNLSKLPRCLNKMSFTPLITPLKPEQELVGVNPRVEPDVTLTLDTMLDLQEIRVQTEMTHSTNSSDLAVCTEDEDVCKPSERSSYQGSWNTYGNAADLSRSNFSESYDHSHWSPRDVHRSSESCDKKMEK